MRRLSLALVFLVFSLVRATVAGAAPAEPKLAFIRDGNLWLQSGGWERSLTTTGNAREPRFSHDGRFIAYRQGREQLVVSTNGGGPWRIPGDAAGGWHPRENLLTVVQGGNLFTVAVTDDGPGAPQTVVSGWTGAAWSPDGRTLAVVHNEPKPGNLFAGTQRVGIVSRSGGPVATILTEKYPPNKGDPVGGAIPMAWSADGSWLLLLRSGLTASMAADINHFAVVSARGGKVHTLGVSPNPRWATWAPAGASVAFVDGAGRSAWYHKELKIAVAPWNVPPLTVTPAGFADREPAWSPDGRILAFTRSLAEAPSTMDRPSPGQGVYLYNLTDKRTRPVAKSEGGFCPFWHAGSIHWLTADLPPAAGGVGTAVLHAERGTVLSAVDLPISYYGQYACDRILDHWSPVAR